MVKRVFLVSKANWTEWLGVVLTFVALMVTTVLTVNSLEVKAVSGVASETSAAQELPAVKLVDQSARAKYLEEQAAKAAAAEAAAEQAARLASEAAAKVATKPTVRPNTTVAAKPVAAKPAPAPTCDRLIIPKIGLNSCLATVGLTGSGAIDVNPSLPAWFNQSSRAGTSSGKYRATFIDGHRSGIFRNLGQLAVGDTVTVSFTSGESYTYSVKFMESTPVNATNMAKVLGIYGGAAQGLNLMTCDGAYNASMGTAVARLTVYATR